MQCQSMHAVASASFDKLTHAQRLLDQPCPVLLQLPPLPALPPLLAHPRLYSSRICHIPALGLSFWEASGLVPLHLPLCSQKSL